MESYKWFAVCVFSGGKLELLSRSIDVKKLVEEKIKDKDQEIFDGIYDCYCGWVTNNDIQSTVFATVFRTKLSRLDPIVVSNRLKVLEEYITFNEEEDKITVWAGIEVDEYLYQVVTSTG